MRGQSVKKRCILIFNLAKQYHLNQSKVREMRIFASHGVHHLFLQTDLLRPLPSYQKIDNETLLLREERDTFLNKKLKFSVFYNQFDEYFE